ncbi:hypothetical protein HDU86_007605 [Geranomyces michiganensis]|nr:hypothetical protein HDU86_007605 [Geranomyces michiganensis]
MLQLCRARCNASTSKSYLLILACPASGKSHHHHQPSQLALSLSIRHASRASSKALRRTPPPPLPPPANITVVHDSTKRKTTASAAAAVASSSSASKASALANDDNTAGRTLVYTGALNSWLDKFRLIAGFMTGVPLVALPWLQTTSVVPIEQTIGLVGLACSIPWVATYVIFKNYVTRMYRYPASTAPVTSSPTAAATTTTTGPPKKKKKPSTGPLTFPPFSSPTARLAFETRTLWGSKRETIVKVANLRYNPKWVLRVWQVVPDEGGGSGGGKVKSLFVEPRVIRDDQVLGALWTQVQRQSPTVDQDSTWFHRFTTDTTDAPPPASPPPPEGTELPPPPPASSRPPSAS